MDVPDAPDVPAAPVAPDGGEAAKLLKDTPKSDDSGEEPIEWTLF